MSYGFNALRATVFLMFTMARVSVSTKLEDAGQGSRDQPESYFHLGIGSGSVSETSWLAMLLNVVVVKMADVLERSFSRTTLVEVFSEATPFSSGVAVVLAGYLIHRICRLSMKIAFRVLPPVFIALEVLSQVGVIGEVNEGIVDWVRYSNVTAAIEESMQMDLPSPADAKPVVEEVVAFLVSRGLLVSVGFLAAFVV